MQLKPSFQITLYGAEDCTNLPYKLTQFSAGELHPQLQEYDISGKIDSIIIKPRTYNPSFIVELSLLVNALRTEFPESVHFDLDLPYVPYSRQDRLCAVGDAFGLKVFADQLNSLNFRYVFIFDAHSDVSPALINNCIHREAKDLFVLNPEFISKYSHLVAPDAGAYKKVNSIASHFNLPVIPALKTRDTATGRLSNTVVVTEGVENPTRLLVIDDLVDAGGTFLALGAKLKQAFPHTPIDLYVSHGIFAKGLNGLDEYYDNIYSHNLFTPIEGVTTLE